VRLCYCMDEMLSLLCTDDNEYEEQQQGNMQVAAPHTANNQVSTVFLQCRGGQLCSTNNNYNVDVIKLCGPVGLCSMSPSMQAQFSVMFM